MTLEWMDRRRCDPGFTELDDETQQDICATCPVSVECALWMGVKPSRSPVASRPNAGRHGPRQGHVESSVKPRKAGAA